MNKTSGVMALSVCVCAAWLPVSAWACSQMQPVAAFVFKNDRNRDLALDINEWLQANASENLIISFKMRDPQEFSRLDVNRDGVVEARELGFDSVRYRQAPCDRVATKMHQMGFRHGANAFAGQ